MHPHDPRSSHSAIDENHLIDQCRAGQREQFPTLIGPYLHSLRLTAYAILQNEADMEEVVQETVLKAFTHLTQLREGDSFKAWLLQIVANEARMRRRKDRKHLFDSVEQEINVKEFKPRQFIDWRDIPSNDLERKEVRQALTEAMDTLDDGYRAVFMLRDVQHLSAAETGKTLGLSEAAVNTRLHRARLQMREQLTGLFRRPEKKWVAMSFKMMMDMGKRFLRRVISCRKAVCELSNYVDGRLLAEVRAQVEEHLRLCDRCSIVLDTTRKLLYIVGDEKIFDLPFECKQNWDRLLQQALYRTQRGNA
jgi:RNA polymerase sigma-70 factor (ECF subfamily)